MSTGIIDGAMNYLADCTHIVGKGTDGIWHYFKYSDGTYHAWYESTINLQAGSVWGAAAGGSYFHKSTSGLTPPSFSKTVTSLVGACNDATLKAYVGHANDYSTYWLTGFSQAINDMKVRLDMYGTW